MEKCCKDQKDMMLFPEGLDEMSFQEFNALGYDGKVCGVIHRDTTCPAGCGMPLGGIDTGCIDIETNGTLGYSTIFNRHVPRGGPLNTPFLALTVGMESWVLSTLPMKGDPLDGLPPLLDKHRGTPIKDIHYWGHYPIVDMEYETDAPVHAALRAWSSFLPGDSAASNTPGAVFEVHVKNTTSTAHKGKLAFNFPGPTSHEANRALSFSRKYVDGNFTGVVVGNNDNVEYALGVIGKRTVRIGGDLGMEGGNWSKIAKNPWYDPKGEFYNELPEILGQAGSSLIVDFDIAAGSSEVIRFVLSWYAPQWDATGVPMGGGNKFTHMYAARFKGALEVAQYLSLNHESLLKRIIAWQHEIYSEQQLPAWLRESLINTLYVITETSFWAQAKSPIGDWCKETDGLFALNESPRSCPQNECLPNTYLSNLGFTYLFPDLVLSTLRAYKEYGEQIGTIPWTFGGITACEGLESRYDFYDPHCHTCEMTQPCSGYQTATNGPSYAGMVDRLLLVTNFNEEILKEFYPSVKKDAIRSMNLRPAYNDGDRVLAMPTGNVNSEWYEHCEWAGMVPHVGGLRLAQLHIAARMAQKVGDKKFEKQCRDWIEAGSESLEKMWDDKCYMNYFEPETGKKSDLVFTVQCDGQWMAKSHGLPRIFPEDHVKDTLATIKEAGIAKHKYGVPAFMTREGIPMANGEKVEYMSSYVPVAYFTSGCFMLGMIYMYEYDLETGLDLIRKSIEAIVLMNRLSWDSPIILDCDTGHRVHGTDYLQIMAIWGVPAALKKVDMSYLCRKGELIDRILTAAKG